MRIFKASILSAALVLAACSSGSTSESADTTVEEVTDASGASDTTLPNTTAENASDCDEIAAQFSAGPPVNADMPDPEVAAVCEADSITVTANGIPDYTYIGTSPGVPGAQDLEFTWPANPTAAATTTDVPALGSAAITLTGVPIYGPTEGTGGDVLSLGGALSECGSHNGPTGFHMHLLATSDTTDCIFTPAEVAAGPQLLGYALDGFPIYTGNEQYTSSWELTDESLFASDTWSAHSYVEGSGDLDECNGLTDADGNYAYYTTDAFPYVIGCYTGEVTLDNPGGRGGPGGDGGPADGDAPTEGQ